MSARSVTSAAKRLEEAAVSACWQQWRALGASLSRTHSQEAKSVVDIEALILLSFAVQTQERRLDDAVAWWASTASRLVSVQRLRSLARRGPAPTQSHLSRFARLASDAGDTRWRRLAPDVLIVAEGGSRALKGPAAPILAAPAALMPRLRAAFGVGAKADVLLFLLTAPRRDPTARELAAALDYTSRAVRTAAEDMVLSGLIEGSSVRPRRYAVQRQPWAELLLSGREFPVWLPCSHAFVLVAHVLAWMEGGEERETTPYLRASAARDLVGAHAPALHGSDSFPKTPQAHGVDYLEAFSAFTGELAAWLDHNI
jgi:hypothetical protein